MSCAYRYQARLVSLSSATPTRTRVLMKLSISISQPSQPKIRSVVPLAMRVLLCGVACAWAGAALPTFHLVAATLRAVTRLSAFRKDFSRRPFPPASGRHAGYADRVAHLHIVYDFLVHLLPLGVLE